MDKAMARLKYIACEDYNADLMAEMVIAAAIDGVGVLTGIGRAPKIAIAKARAGNIEDVEEIEVKWDETHEREQEGLHHSNVAKFLRAHNVTDIVAAGAGADMQRMGIIGMQSKRLLPLAKIASEDSCRRLARCTLLLF